jgi:zinc/manganese transport system substrate-binding protein
MKNSLRLILALLAAALTADAKLTVVATLPDFGDLAQRIGGDAVTVTSLVKSGEDPHFIVPKPSYIRTLNKADLLIEGGADLESGWLPPLVAGARNAKIMPGSPGRLSLANCVELIEVTSGPVDRSAGDVHPKGNPHFWLAPANGKRIAAALAATFTQLAPADADGFKQRLAAFTAELDAKSAAWTEALQPFAGTKVVTYHKSFDYLLRHFGFTLAGTIEPKPGIEPSAAHIASLTASMKALGVKLIITEAYSPRKTAEQLAAVTGARLVVLPDKSGEAPASDYLRLFETQVNELTKALKPAP